MRETRNSFPWTSALVEQDVINKLHDLFRGENSDVPFSERLMGVQQLVMSGDANQQVIMNAEWVRTRNRQLTWKRMIERAECIAPGLFTFATCFLVLGLSYSQDARAEKGRSHGQDARAEKKERSHEAFVMMWYFLAVTGWALTLRCGAKLYIGRNIAQTESQACVVLRSRLSSLAEKLRCEGKEEHAKQADKMASFDFTTFSMMTDIEQASLIKGVGPVSGQARGGGGGGGRSGSERVLGSVTSDEAKPLLKTEDTSRERACCIM